jgi:hypothetical protein
MINSQGTSFIPQRPSKGKANTRRVRKIYVLSFVSYIMFFGSVLAAVGVFFLNFSLDSQLERQKQLLAAERDQFNQGEIESIRDLEKRIELAQERLNNHVSVLSVLQALEQSAVQSIKYMKFSYKRLNDMAPIVTLSGDTDRFNSVLFQREVLESNPVLAGSTFTEVGMVSKELENPPFLQKVVAFTFEKEIEKELIGYTPREAGATSQPVQQQEFQEQEEQVEQVEQSSSEGASEVSDEVETADEVITEGI